MDSRVIVKELHLNPDLKVTDFFGTTYDPQFHKEIGERVKLKPGEMFYILAFGPRKGRKKRIEGSFERVLKRLQGTKAFERAVKRVTKKTR